MSKKTRVTIPFNPDKLLDVLVAKMSLQDLASKTGTSPADFVEWVYLERIPPRVLSDIVKVLDLDPITVGGILGDTPEETVGKAWKEYKPAAPFSFVAASQAAIKESK